MLEHKWPEQEFPVRSGAGRAMARDELEVLAAIRKVGGREDTVVCVEPFHAVRAVAAVAVLLPEPGVCAPEPEHGVLRYAEGKIVCVHLERDQRDVRVEEKVHVGVRDAEGPGRSTSLQGDARGSDVAAPISADAGLTAAPGRLLSRGGSVQEALCVRQERDELPVVPLLERARILAELVDDFGPRTVGHGVEQLPVALNRTRTDGHELYRPQRNLAEMADHRVAGHGICAVETVRGAEIARP